MRPSNRPQAIAGNDSQGLTTARNERPPLPSVHAQTLMRDTYPAHLPAVTALSILIFQPLATSPKPNVARVDANTTVWVGFGKIRAGS